MRKETLQVCFGCLLHDIGKLVYRAGGESGSHSRQGWDFLRQLWPEEREILYCVRLHHAAELRQAQPPADSPAWIACAADNLSAAADRREAGEEERSAFRRYQPLESVFSHLNGEHPGFAIPPQPQDGKLRMPQKALRELNAAQYQAALTALRPRLQELPREEAWLDSLLCLLESYTGVFPSSTFTGESPDISLFDHLKTTAAIGACISEYLADCGERDFKARLFTGEARFREEKAFLLYSADFSGIQRFLYTVASDKALRSLRSRSFFLELAMEHYIDELLRLCGLGRTNLLYSGGGHCYALLPNTEKVRQAAEDWNRRFNDWLCEQFGVSLFLAQGWTACSGNELTNTPAEAAPYRAMFRRAGFKLKVLTPLETAYGALLTEYTRRTGAPEIGRCVVDLGHRGTLMHFLQGGECVGVREIDLGLAELDQRIAEEMGVEIHAVRGYKQSNFNGVLDTEYAKEFYSRLAVEIMKAVNFYHYNNRDRELEELYLCGGGAAIRPLRETIAATVKLKVKGGEELLADGMRPAEEPWLYLRPIGGVCEGGLK